MNARVPGSLFILLFVVTATMLAQDGTRDVVYLKNGSIIRGTVREMIPDSTIRIQTGDGNVFVYSMRDVAKITKEESSSAQDRPGSQWKSDRRPETQLAGLVGYGTVDGYNFGFGVRVGTTFPSGFYFGGTFVYHVGKSSDLSIYNGFGFYTFKVTVSSLYGGLEIGSDTRVSDNFVIRPYGSFGYFSAMATAEGYGSSASDSEGRFYIGPGLLLNILPSEQARFGLDARYVIVTGKGGSDASSFGIFLAVGLAL